MKISVKNCFIRGSVVRYVQLPPQAIDTALLQDAARREAAQPSTAQPANVKKFSPHSFSSLGLRKTQSTGDIDDGALTPLSSSSVSLHPQRIVIVNHKSTDTIVSILRSPDQPPLSPPISETPDDHRELATKLREITACDMDLLLSLETQARMDVQEKKQRASHVRFELPITPPTHSPDSEQQQFIYARQRRWSLPEDGTEDMLKKDSFTLTRLSRWSRLMKQQQQEEARHNQLLLGQSNSSLE
ncbi:hypothetical protein A0J61_11898, partial [Choanephora cucurbitarum]